MAFTIKVAARNQSNRIGACQGPIAGLLAISATWALSAWAADSPPQPALTEIIVTAQKRQQNIQDVPVSVMAVSAQQLQDAGVKDIKNLQVLTPGVTVTSTTSENVTTARIRGIGTVGDNPGLESSVGVIIDGVYRPRNGVGFRRSRGDRANRGPRRAAGRTVRQEQRCRRHQYRDQETLEHLRRDRRGHRRKL
jgi:outer membrane receptor for ferrienterochelin and colicin